MSPSAKQLVDAQLANSEPDPNARPVTPEQTTQSGVAPENALYDSPRDGSQSAEFRSGRRQRRSTERGGRWLETFNRAERIRKKGNRTRKVNSARRAHSQESQNTRDDDSQGPAHAQLDPQPNLEPTRAQPDPEPTRAQPNPGPLPERRKRGRSRKVHDISRSPTPGSTDHEIEKSTTQQATAGTQYTYIYETLDHEGLVEYAKENYGIDGRRCNTQSILAKIYVAERDQETHVGPPRLPPSINPLPAVPLQVGGGWHRAAAASQPANSRGTKRRLGASDEPGASTKRPRVNQAPESNTDTMSETDEEWAGHPMRVPSEYVLRGPPGASLNQRPNVAQSAPGNRRPPPPSDDSVPSRSVTGQPSRSQYGGPSTTTHPLPPIPTLLSPVRGPVHARLRKKALERFFDSADRDAEAAEADDPSPTAQTNDLGAPAPTEDEDEDFDQLARANTDEVPETDFGPGSPAPTAAPQRTYGGSRTHLPSEPESTPAESDNEDEPDPDLQPNSSRLTSAQLIQRERTRAVAAKALAEARELTSQRQRSRLFAEATSAPIARPQARPPPGTSGDALGGRMRGTCRVDPVGAARADMIRFNEACAREEATSFVQSVTRESERRGRCAPLSSRLLHDLLDDEEEQLARAEAFAKKKWPYSRSSRGRKRKPKPLARDVSGIERQILIVTKLHLFVYALVQGIYQTRATFLRWAAAVHHATWQMELPTTPYVKPIHEILEIMVNSIATLRGKVKERMRPFTAHAAGFEQRQTNQEVIQENLNRFNLLHPNNFHCKTYCPRKGHLENPEIGHCIAVALFHGPGSVGVMYPDYFVDMPLTVVAFALAIWQFCIEEWANGWHQSGDLGTAAMREKYESMLAQLKELRDVAPRRMDRLQTQWRDYVMEYSGARLTSPQEGQMEGSRESEMRPDTPDLEMEDEAGAQATNAIDVDEMDHRLLETARQASLEELARQIAAREELESEPDAPMDEDEGAEPRAPTPPPAEYNSQGRLTAHSKGKGRAN